MHQVAEAHVKIRGDTSSVEGDVRSGVGGAIAGFAKKGAVAAGVGVGASLIGGMKSAFDLNDAKLPLAQVASGQGLEIAKQVTDDMVAQFGISGVEAGDAVFSALSAGLKPEQLAREMETIGKAGIGLGLDAQTSANIAALGLNGFGENAESTFAKIAAASADALGDAGTFAAVMPEAGAAAASMGVSLEEVAALLTQSSKTTQDLNKSATGSKNLFNELNNTTTGVGKAFKEMAGASFSDFIASGGSATDALKMLQEQADANGLTIAEMFSSVEAKQFATDAINGMDEVEARMQRAADGSFSDIDALYQNQRQSAAQLFNELKGKLTVAFSQLATKVLPVVFRVMDRVGQAVQSFIDNGGIERVEATLTNVGNTIQTYVAPVLAAFGTWFVESGMPLLRSFGEFISVEVLPVLAMLGQWFVEEALPRLSQFAEFVTGVVIPTIGEIARYALDIIIPALQDLGTWFQDELVPRVQAFVDQVTTNLGPTIEAAQDFFRNGLLPAISAVVGVIRDHLVPFLMRIVDAINDYVVPFVLDHLIPAFFDVVTFITGEVIPVLADLVGWFIDQIIPAIEDIGTWLGDAIIWFSDTAVAIADFVTDGIDAFNDFKDGAQRGMERVREFIQPVVDLVQSLIDKVRDAVNAVSNLPGAGLIGDAAGFLFADGGLVTKATRGIVGEAGPELILPLTRPQRMRELMAQAGGPVLAALSAAGERIGSGDSTSGAKVINYNVQANDPWAVVTEIERFDEDLAGAGR